MYYLKKVAVFYKVFMEWYIPITIVPAVALLILSTANLLIALNTEITDLHQEKRRYDAIIRKKLKQLKILNLALIAEYSSAFFMVFAGVTSAIYPTQHIQIALLFLAVFFLFLALIILIKFSIHSLKIRQDHLKL